MRIGQLIWDRGSKLISYVKSFILIIFFLFDIGAIVDNSTGDVAEDQYHRYKVILEQN